MDLRENFYELEQHFPGFQEVLIQALFALVGMEHLLWYSLPGRAKSMVARAIFGMFDGAKVLTTQLTKDMMPDDVFGDVIANELINSGRRIINLEGGIAAVEFAYLDEFMDAGDYLLRSMLNVLNEREYHGSKDMASVSAPLHTAIATTNFMRQREATEAVLDRLLCKAELAGIEELTDCMRAGQTYLGYSGKMLQLPHKLPYEGLKQLSDQVMAPLEEGGVLISPGMRLLHVVLVQEFQRLRHESAVANWHQANPDAAEEPSEEEVSVPEVTPRTLVKLHDMSRAAAVLNERDEVVPEDNRALGYGIYVVGDKSGDDELWHDLCDTFLKFNSKQRQSLEELGEIADNVGQIKAECSEVTNLQLHLGGQAIQFADLGKRKLADRLRNVDHPVLDIAKKRLDDEISELTSQSGHCKFDLLKGWS